MSDGAQQIAAERGRQIITEGYTIEGDIFAGGVLPLIEAAQTYAIRAQASEAGFSEEAAHHIAVENWPWDPKTFKPTTTKRDLVKAGALIAAAIDQLDLAERANRPLAERGFEFSADAPTNEED